MLQIYLLFFKKISTRTEKIGSVIQRSLAPLLLEFEEEYGIITITKVNVYRDLSEAKIFLDAKRSAKRLIETLNRRSNILKKEVFANLTQKRTPKFRFVLDIETIATRKIEELLEE